LALDGSRDPAQAAAVDPDSEERVRLALLDPLDEDDLAPVRRPRRPRADVEQRSLALSVGADRPDSAEGAVQHSLAVRRPGGLVDRAIVVRPHRVEPENRSEA